MTVYVVNSGLGNFRAVTSILRRIGKSSVTIDGPTRVTADDRVILPGVGAFDAGMRALENRGFDDFIREAAIAGVPMLGICLGMQLLCRGSEEGRLPGLGVVPADVKKLELDGTGLRLPHMGWSEALPVRSSLLFDQAAGAQRFYFVHSYAVHCDDPDDVAATTDYGGTFTSAFARKNIFGAQFHPEKSHRFGMALLDRFVGESG